MIISIDAGKVLDINPTSFYDKITTKLITKQSRQGNIGTRIDILGNRIENPKINYHIYGQMISNKHAKTIQWRKNSLLRHRAGTTQKLDPYFTL